MAGNGGRTHEPTLRELTGQLDDLKELMIEKVQRLSDKIEERDRLYIEKFRAGEIAVSAAITASDKQTAASFASSEKAIFKAEEAQREYNVRSNEFRGQLDDQAKTLMPRMESQTLFKAYEDKLDDMKDQIANLRESRSEGGGKESARHGDLLQRNWLIVAFCAAASLIVSVLAYVKTH